MNRTLSRTTDLCLKALEARKKALLLLLQLRLKHFVLKRVILTYSVCTIGNRYANNPSHPSVSRVAAAKGGKWLKSLHVSHLFFSSYFTILEVIQLHYTEMPLGIVMGSWKHGAIFNEYLPYEQNDEFILSSK